MCVKCHVTGSEITRSKTNPFPFWWWHLKCIDDTELWMKPWDHIPSHWSVSLLGVETETYVNQSKAEKYFQVAMEKIEGIS